MPGGDATDLGHPVRSAPIQRIDAAIVRVAVASNAGIDIGAAERDAEKPRRRAGFRAGETDDGLSGRNSADSGNRETAATIGRY